MQLVGTWHIVEMEMWDEEYLNMERPAFIQIGSNRLGHFQFGLVYGQIDGEFVNYQGQEHFDFTWDGNDVLDPVSGAGWLRLLGGDTLEGWIKIHLGDSSMLKAVKVA